MKNKTTKKRGENVEHVVLDKSVYKSLIEDLLGMKDLYCNYCKTKINKDNFGVIMIDKCCCNSVVCIIEYVEEMMEKEI